MEFTAAHGWLKNNNLSDEEKNVVAIFQTFNNKAIDCMKDQAYRQVMQEFWTKELKNRCELMSGNDLRWGMSNMKALLTTMLYTASNILFQRLPCKVACYERYHRFLEIMRHYRHWFVESKCMADEEFVLAYEKQRLEQSVSAQSFDGMWPEMQQKGVGAKGEAEYIRQHHTRPAFGKYKKVSNARLGTSNVSNNSSASISAENDVLSEEELRANQQKDEERLASFRTMFDDKLTDSEFDAFLATITTPVGRKVLTEHRKDFVQTARWGHDEDSFTERLAKIQNW
jgi:hypothetical protein